MLIIEIINTNEGTNENAHYRYAVRVNSEEIARGLFDGHNRNDGWAELVRAISERHLTKRGADDVERCQDCGYKLINGECQNSECL